MPSKLRKGMVSRCELLPKFVAMHAGVSPSVILKKVQINYGWLDSFNVCSNKWKEIKAKPMLHLVALLEEIEHQ